MSLAYWLKDSVKSFSGIWMAANCIAFLLAVVFSVLNKSIFIGLAIMLIVNILCFMAVFFDAVGTHRTEKRRFKFPGEQLV